MLTNGKTAGQLADERGTPVVLFDLCADYAHASAIAISCAAQNDAQHNAKATRLLQSLGKRVIPLPDYPGLLTMRTLAMLANEALDVVNKGVANAEDTDLAMLRGVNYPRGPLAWGAALDAGKPATLLRRSALSPDAAAAPLRFPRLFPRSRTMNANTPRALAQRCAEQMFQQDTCAQAMGMHIDAVDAGYAQVSMTVGPQMLNGHQTCHGGQLFSLADTAFAYACNSQGLAAVASGCSIDFVRPALAGDRLTASAEMRHQGKATGLYDVEIVNQRGKTVAWFRGRAHRLGHSILGDQA
jgi:acyl-CoA thioesterase